MQESGRAGRDGDVACATIMCKGSDLDRRRVFNEMIMYCRNKTQCRHSILFSNFDSVSVAPGTGQDNPTGCLCCDVHVLYVLYYVNVVTVSVVIFHFKNNTTMLHN